MTSIAGGLGRTHLGAWQVEHSSQQPHQSQVTPAHPINGDTDKLIDIGPGTPTSRCCNGEALADFQAGEKGNFMSIGESLDAEYDSEVEFEGDYEDDEFVGGEYDDVLHGK